MAAVAALVAVVFLANRTHHCLRSRFSRDTKRLPPGPPRWPIVGNLLQLGRFPHRDMAALYEKYGPLVYLRLGSVDAITTTPQRHPRDPRPPGRRVYLPTSDPGRRPPGLRLRRRGAGPARPPLEADEEGLRGAPPDGEAAQVFRRAPGRGGRLPC